MEGTKSRLRVRWAAIGAAVAVAIGGGGIGIATATVSSGDKPVFVSIDPQRILDTRSSIGLDGKFGDAAPRDLQVTGSVEVAGGSSTTVVPDGATGVALNVTVVQPDSDGFLSVRPSGATGEPQTSNVNFLAGEISPNGVNVDLPADGRIQIWFEAYTPGGTGDVLVDVVGYYDDHTHDDRYYTKSQVEDMLATQPWSESMPVTAAHWTSLSVSYKVAGGGSDGTEGLWIDTSENLGRFFVGFTLPPQYAAGSDVVVRMGWAAESDNATGCGFNVWINDLDVARPGEQVLRPTATWEDPLGFNQDVTVLEAPTSLGPGEGSNIVAQGTYFTIDGTDLQPGDHVQIALARDVDEDTDTCTESLIILGLNAEPA